jgi:cation diffusion facilitator family transporter
MSHDHAHGHDHDHHDEGGHHHHHHLLARGEIATRAAALSIGSNILLTLVECSTGLWMGSAAVIAAGLHSATDLVASFSAYFAVRMSSRPASEVHPYGHGKYEDLAAVFEASLIVVATVGVVWKAVTDFLFGHGVHHAEFGMGVMVFSIILNTIVSRYLFKTAKETDSVALEADAWHLAADVMTSIGVLIGLGLVALTGIQAFDPLAALLVGVYILREAVMIGRTGVRNLLDTRLPDHEVADIERILAGFTGPTCQFHGIRTRKGGAERHIDLHLVVQRSMTTGDAHDLCHEVEGALKKRFPGAHVLIHLESANMLVDVRPRSREERER